MGKGVYREVLSVRRLSLAAFLLVLDILAINLSSLFTVEGLSFVRPSLSPAIVILSSLLTGPLYGAVVGGAGDALAILLRGAAGTINPFITLVYVGLGALPYFLYKFGRSLSKIAHNPYFLFVSMGLFVAASLLAINLPYLFEGFDGRLLAWLKPVLSAVVTIIGFGSALGVFFLQRRYDGRGKPGGFDPLGAYFVCFVSEISLMVLYKSLAFYFFYAFLSGGTPIPYPFLLSSLLLLCPFDVMVNTYVVTLLLSVMKKIDKDILPEVDEGQLSAEDRETYRKSKRVPVGWLVFFGLMAAAIVACLIVISVL